MARWNFPLGDRPRLGHLAAMLRRGGAGSSGVLLERHAEESGNDATAGENRAAKRS
jgi:hypothetical protein